LKGEFKKVSTKARSKAIRKKNVNTFNAKKMAQWGGEARGNLINRDESSTCSREGSKAAPKESEKGRTAFQILSRMGDQRQGNEGESRSEEAEEFGSLAAHLKESSFSRARTRRSRKKIDGGWRESS